MTSLSSKAKLLLFISAFDCLILGWVNVWWVVVFLQAINQKIIPINNALMPLVSMFGMVYVIKRFSKPSFRQLFCGGLFSYLSLFFMFHSLELFMLASTIMSVFYTSMTTVFNNRIRAMNVPDPEERTRFDDRQQLVRDGMTFFGSLLSYFVIWLGVPIWLSWLLIYLLYDLDIFTKYFLVKRGVLIYSEEIVPNSPALSDIPLEGGLE